MSYPKITIVTPSYNQGEFLEETILSVLSQEYPNLEYIICDGGSTDNSVEIIKKYADRLAWWCSEKDKGQTVAINKGMHRATGDIVGWINSDDVLLPGALLEVGRFFMKHPDCEFANGDGAVIGRDGTVLKFTHLVVNKWFMERGYSNIVQQGMFWRRDLFGKLGFLDETFHAIMDVEWLIRNYEGGTKIMLLDRPLGAIRVYEETKTAMGGHIWKDDRSKLQQMYGGRYYRDPLVHNKYRFLFYAYKYLRGCYLKNWLWERRYKGRSYKEVCIGKN